MTLAEQVRKGQALPVEVQPEQQETMALGSAFNSLAAL